jgi:hypothetical protein
MPDTISCIRLRATRYNHEDSELWDERLLEVLLRLNQLGIHATLGLNVLEIDSEEADWEWADATLAKRAEKGRVAK